MYKLLVPALALFAAVACSSGKDSGDTSGGGGPGPSVDSCDWPNVGLCYEFTDYSGTEAWCADIGDQYGFSTTYSSSGCADGTQGKCKLPAGGDFDVATTAYYGSDYTPTDNTGAQADCENAGGTYQN